MEVLKYERENNIFLCGLSYIDVRIVYYLHTFQL